MQRGADWLRGLVHESYGRLNALIVLGALQLGLYGLICGLSPRFAFETEPRLRPIVTVLLLFGAAFLLYLLSLALVWNAHAACRRFALVMFGFAAAFRLVLWFSQPIQESDFYRYLWDGRVVAAGMNPFQFSPAQIERAGETVNPSASLKRLADLTKRSPELQRIFSRIHQREVPTIYPPLSQAVFAGAALITPADLGVTWQIRILQSILLLFDLATLVLVWLILRDLAMPVGRGIAYAWCPLVLREFANSAHLDSIVVCCVTLAVWLLLKAHSAGEKRQRAVLDSMAATAWALAILAKLFPVILGPLFLRVWWTRLRWRSLLLLSLSIGVVAAAYSPMLLRKGQSESQAADPFAGLRTFLRRWEMNDLVFMLVQSNLCERETWFTVAPRPWRAAVEGRAAGLFRRLGITMAGTNSAFLLTQLLLGGSVLTICLWLGFRSWPGEMGSYLLESVFLCLAWLWFLSPTQNPWYWTWALPFVVFTRNRAWLVVSGLAFAYYLRFWLQDHFPERTLFHGSYSGTQFFDDVIVWLEHAPILVLLALGAARERLGKFKRRWKSSIRSEERWPRLRPAGANKLRDDTCAPESSAS